MSGSSNAAAEHLGGLGGVRAETEGAGDRDDVGAVRRAEQLLEPSAGSVVA